MKITIGNDIFEEIGSTEGYRCDHCGKLCISTGIQYRKRTPQMLLYLCKACYEEIRTNAAKKALSKPSLKKPATLIKVNIICPIPNSNICCDKPLLNAKYKVDGTITELAFCSKCHNYYSNDPKLARTYESKFKNKIKSKAPSLEKQLNNKQITISKPDKQNVPNLRQKNASHKTVKQPTVDKIKKEGTKPHPVEPKKQYAMPSQYNGTEILLSFDYVVRRTNTFKHFANDHDIKDVELSIPISRGIGNTARVTAPGTYCRTCQRLYILEPDYISILHLGAPLCEIIKDGQVLYGENMVYVDGFGDMREESFLRKLGYNVNKHDNIPIGLRWHILESAIDNRLLAKSQILSLLDYLINTHWMQDSQQEAVSKWEDDREHIAQYKPKDLSEMKVYKLLQKDNT